jgi:hypothetical protein
MLVDINSAQIIVANVSCTTCVDFGMTPFYNSESSTTYYNYTSNNWYNTSVIPMNDLQTEGFVGDIQMGEESWDIYS